MGLEEKGGWKKKEVGRRMRCAGRKKEKIRRPIFDPNPPGPICPRVLLKLPSCAHNSEPSQQ